MNLLTVRNLLAVAVCAAAVTAMLPAPAWSQAKQPPTCAAITFRPLPDDVGDGDQDAGLYKSRFGRIIVKGAVKGGKVETYFVTVNNTKVAAAGTLPASVASCAASKKLPAPGKPADVCLGDRLQVLIDHSSDKRYVLLYARNRGGWQLCSAGAA
jgi:hypothetical protein